MTLPVGSISGTLRLIGAAEFDQGVIGAQRSMNLAAASADKMAAGVDRADAALTASGRSASAASVGAAKLRAAQLSATAATERYNAVIGDENASLARLASSEASMVRANLRLADSQKAASTASKEASLVMADSRSKFASFGKTAAGLGLALGAFELAAKAIDITKEAAAYQAAMTRIRTLTGASTAEVKQMSTALLGLAGKVAQSPEDLATSLYHVESVGLHGAKALNAVTVAAKGAKIGNTDLEDTTNSLTSTIASGILKTQSYSGAMSDLLSIVGSGDMTFQQFNEAMSTGVLTTLAGFGLSLKDVGAALALFGDSNIRGAHAATQLRMAVQALADPVKGGAAALASLGLSTTQLGEDLKNGGLKAAIGDLSAHIKQAGYNAHDSGLIITQAFGKRAGTGINILVDHFDQGTTTLLKKYADLEHGAQTFGQRWSDVTKTAAFQFSQLGHEAEAAGLVIAEKVTPSLGTAARLLGGAVKFGLSTAQGALKPFADGWHLLASGVSAATGPLRAVGGALSPLAPVLKGVGAAALAMWVAFKGYQIAKAAMLAVQDAAIASGLAVKNAWGTQVQRAMESNASVSLTTGRIMQAEFAQIEASALQAAAAQDKATAMQAQAFADQTAASSASTDAQVADADARAAAALAAARTSATSATVAATASEEASAAIVSSGEAARVGWAGLAGPIGLAAIGVLAVVSMFHKSSTASKEATDAAKAYTDALSGGGGKTTVIDSIVKQLSDNNVPELLKSLNDELGHTAFTGSQFVTAIEKGGAPLDALRTRLEAIIKAGSTVVQGTGRMSGAIVHMTPAAKDATTALGHLNTQYTTLTKSAQKELLKAKSFGLAASSIDKVSHSTQVGSDTAKQYAAMMGILVDQNGIAAVSAKKLTGAVDNIKSAYGHATESGDGFLAALKTFSSSAGTAADRAALIGATLKAANGDQLNYITQMNNGAAAARTFATDTQSAAKSVGKNGESTRAYLASIINLKNGTIDYKNAAAQPLISDLNSIQTAAMAAAQAQFQHAKGTMSAKDAADQAYHVYKNQTQGALIDEATKLGLTKDQAKKLADQYFGMPKHVKTLIEQEGGDPILHVLNKIGRLLANLTGQTWTANVQANISQANHGLDTLATKIHGIVDQHYNVSIGVVESNGVRHGGNAAGGEIHGPGSGTSDSIPARLSNGEFVVKASQAQKNLGLLHAINSGADGFADGGEVTKRRGHWFYNGISYSSKQAAENARKRDISGSANSHASSAITDISTAKTGFSFATFLQQVKDAGKALKEAIAAGASKSQIRSLTDRLDKAEKEGERRERALGRGILREGRGLGTLIGQTNPNKVASRADVASSLHGLEASLQQAGLSKQFIKSLGDENKQILNDVTARDKAAAGVAKANAAVIAAQKKMHSDMAAFKAASIGSFDITSAGQDANGRVSKGSLRAAQTQDLTRVREWVSGMKQLAHKHVFPAAYLRELANKGPDALPTVKALLSMSGAELADFANTQKTIARLSGQEANVVGHRLDQGQINRDRHRQRLAEEREKRAQKHLDNAMKHLADRIDHALKHGHFDGDLKFSPNGLARVVLEGEKKAKSHRGGAK